MAMMWEELAYGDGGFAYTLTANIFYNCHLPHMSKELKNTLFPKIIEDDTYLFAFAVSEHRGMTEVLLTYEPGGFDTYAVRKNDQYIINGTKAYCSGAPVSKAIVVHMKTDRKAPLTKSWSAFLIPVGTPGFSIGKIHDHLGFRTLLTSELALEDVHVPTNFLLGEEGFGITQNAVVVPVILVFKMSCLLGVCRALYEEAVNYARTRIVCGKPIIQHDTIKVMLADMRMKIAAARGMVWKIAWDLDHHPEKVKENIEMAFLFKGFIGSVAPDIIKHADEVHGGMGTNKEVLTEKLIRDAFTFLHGMGNTTVAFLNGAPTLED